MPLPSRELSNASLDALAARERTRVVAPLTEWHTLAAVLRDEGIVRADGTYNSTSAPAAPAYERVTPRRGGLYNMTVRFAASLALLGVGAVFGRGMTLGHEIAPAIREAIHGDSSGSTRTFETSGQAKAALARSQMEYQRAAAYLAATDPSARLAGGPEEYQERLRALDEMLRVGQVVVRESPHDPVINQYYLSAINMRQATLQQLSQVLPADVHVVRY